MKNEELTSLYKEQLREFELAAKNYAELKHVVRQDVNCGTFSIGLQYNPARMISTNAKIDQATLQSRPCFLCKANRPQTQKGLPYGGHYDICVNPYPIFPQHFTIPTQEHIPQLIGNRIEDLLSLAFDFPEYTSFYNGPDCGASAPDHFHFQMVPRHMMPLEEDVEREQLRQVIVRKDFYTISYLKDYLREVILLQGSDLKLMSALFAYTRTIIGETTPYEKEPMMNILVWFENCQWTVCIFPRKLRRPWQFFAEGEDKILFSPGCVDMAGMIVAPRKEDFDRYSCSLLTDLFGQVTITPESMVSIVHKLKNIHL